MIKVPQILAIKTEKLFNNKLRVRRLGQNSYAIYGYNYGEEEFKHQGDEESVAKYLNQFFGYSQ